MVNKISIALLAAASVVSLCMLPRTGTDAAKLLPAREEGKAHKYSAWPVILALVVLGVFIPLLLHLAGLF